MHPSGMLYDNMNVSKVTPATADDLFCLRLQCWFHLDIKYVGIANFTGADVSGLNQYILGRVNSQWRLVNMK